MMQRSEEPQPEFARLVYRCADYGRVAPFYRDLLGLTETAPGRLAAADSDFELVFEQQPQLEIPHRAAVGLYHTAFLLPDRAALAAVVRRLLNSAGPRASDPSSAPFRLEGGADHLVSEAVYLRDSENNGVELYADRDPAQWRWNARGSLEMTTEPLDFESLLSQSSRESTVPAGTRIGHIHLHVPDLDRAEAVYREKLALSVTQRDYPGARFLAWGRYHHHLGINTWAGNRPPARPTTGLAEVRLRLSSPSVTVEEFRDPCGIRWIPRAAEPRQ